MTTEQSTAAQPSTADAGSVLARRLLERRRCPGVIDLAHARSMADRGLCGTANSTLLARLTARRGTGEMMIADGELVLAESGGEAAAAAEATVTVPAVPVIAVAPGIVAARPPFIGEVQGIEPIRVLAASAGFPVHRVVTSSEAARPTPIAETLRESVVVPSADRVDVMPAPSSSLVPALASGQAPARPAPVPGLASGRTAAFALAPITLLQPPVPASTLARTAVSVPAQSTADPATTLPPLPDAAPMNLRHESAGGAMQLPAPPSASQPQSLPLAAAAETAVAGLRLETMPARVEARDSVPPEGHRGARFAAPSGVDLSVHSPRPEMRLSLVRAEVPFVATEQEPLTLAASAVPASAARAAPAEDVSSQASSLDPRREPSRIEPVVFPVRADAIAAGPAEEHELSDSETRRLADAVGRSLERSLMRARERRGERSWKN